MNTQTPGVLADRDIRVLCEVPVADMCFRDTRDQRQQFKPIHVPVFADEARDIPALAERLGPIYVGRYVKLDAVTGFSDTIVREQKARLQPMIAPFSSKQVKTKSVLTHSATDGSENDIYEEKRILSWGLTSYGYDVRLADTFKIFSNANAAIVDPKHFNEDCLVDAKLHRDTNGDRFAIIPPNSYLLGHTVEVFDIPRDVLVIAIGKSTYARAGAIVNVTPIEPGFKGQVVIEISNSTPLPLKVYADEGIAQFVFHRGANPCEVSYGDRAGKYQNQRGVTLSKV